MENEQLSRRTFGILAVGLGLISAIAATGLAYYLRPDPPKLVSSEEPSERPGVEAHLFRGWPKPEVALLLSGQQNGYLLPCGCSRPQVGGLERRYNLLAKLKEAGWPVVPVDVGDIPQTHGPRDLPNKQGMLKYTTSMKSLKKMGYEAVGIGEHETNFGLLNLLSEFRLNDDSISILAANVEEKDNKFLSMIGSVKVAPVKGTDLKVGVAATIGPTVEAKLKDGDVKLASNGEVLNALTKQLAGQKADLNVLLYQGYPREAASLAKDFPQFHVILCLSEESEPPSDPLVVGETRIIRVGHKGRYVGVLGAYRTKDAKKPFDFRYDLVSLDESFMTAQGKANPIVDLMETYTRTLKNERYLAKYPQRPHRFTVEYPGKKPTYVGSDKCAKCHRREYQVWESSKHAHAYDSLLTAERPANRQFDAECIVCHTIGFGVESGFRSVEATPHLKNVGCESCHGPASGHLEDKNDERWHDLMNPWRAKFNETPEETARRKLKIDQFCQKCHDIDNDVHYKFEKRWPKIEH